MDKISILDFGCQYTHLIGRRVRQLNVYSEILPSETPASKLGDSKGVILSGSPESVYDPGAPTLDPEILDLDIPSLGICYGAQLMAHVSGGEVLRGDIGEYGRSDIVFSGKDRLFDGLEQKQTVWMSHGDSIDEVPPGFEIKAMSKDNIVAVMVDPKRDLYGLQFHPEVSHTPNGMKVLENFVVDICGCDQDWTMESYIGKAQRHIRDMVGDGKALVLVSGGIDSTVAYVLAQQTLGSDRVYALHIDNGLMRKNESYKISRSLMDAGITNLTVVDRGSDFLRALKGVYEPEVKRERIGNVFMDVTEDELPNLGLYGDVRRVQGTLYTDLVESGKGVGRKTAKIKTHHNVSAKKVEELRKKGLIVEPNSDLYKDEVREVGKLLGIPDELVWRQPFPGPGLAIRIVGNVGATGNIEETYSEVREIAGDYGLEGFVVPIKTVGVQGSDRSYKSLAMLHGKNDWERIRTASEEILKNVHDINRCTYVIDGKPNQDALKGIKPMEVNERSVSLLREIDHRANQSIKKYGLEGKIDQMPVTIFSGTRMPMVGVRDVKTDDYMTAAPLEMPEEFPWECLYDMRDSIRGLEATEVFVRDTSPKPPSTIEWE